MLRARAAAHRAVGVKWQHRAPLLCVTACELHSDLTSEMLSAAHSQYFTGLGSKCQMLQTRVSPSWCSGAALTRIPC